MTVSFYGSASPRQLALFSLAWAWLTDAPISFPSVFLCVRLRSGGKIPESSIRSKIASYQSKVAQLTALALAAIIIFKYRVSSLWLLLFFVIVFRVFFVLLIFFGPTLYE